MARTKLIDEKELMLGSKKKNKSSTKATSKMKTYRFRMETIEALEVNN